jgi:predicted 3-demethylubiquinone-9 3-methyltransferase (glyoxalase superfamily)
MQPITPCLWFDGKAEEAANFYISVFRNSRIMSVARYGDAGPGPKGAAMIVNFQLEGQDFLALNGGPQYTFTPAISFLRTCETQREIDDLWTKLTGGGQESQCGWLTDKFGVSWQIVPSVLSKLMQDKDPARSKRVMESMLTMRKLDIKRLQDAANDPLARQRR